MAVAFLRDHKNLDALVRTNVTTYNIFGQKNYLLVSPLWRRTQSRKLSRRPRDLFENTEVMLKYNSRLVTVNCDRWLWGGNIRSFKYN